MFKKRNRWVVSSVLAIAVFAFLGIMVVLPFAGALQSSRSTPSNDPSASPSPGSGAELTDAQKADLEAQVRGYQLVLEREPGNQTALRGLVEAQIQLGNVEGTVEPLKKLVAANPATTEYAVLLAQAQNEMGDREGAAQTYRDVLSTRPGDMQALQGLVGLLMQAQRPEAAIGLLQDTLNLADEANQTQPGSVDVVSVQLMLGQVYAQSGRVSDSLAIYDEAAKLDSQDFRPILAKAIVLQATGNDAEAQPLFTQAESMAPSEFKDQIKLMAAGQAPGQSESTETPDSASPDASASPDTTDSEASPPAASE